MRYLILAVLLVGCGDTPDKDPPNNTPSNTPNNTSSNSTNNGTSSTNNGTANTTNSSECIFDIDCEVGEVCQQQDMVCIVASCEFCTADQICYKASPEDAGSCSASECETDDDCGSTGTCSAGVCARMTGCTTNEDCDEGEICDLAGECVAE